MSKLNWSFCALLCLFLAACNSTPHSRSFDGDRPAIEVRPGKARQERGSKEFTYKGSPVYLGDATYFEVAGATATQDAQGHPAVAIQLADEEQDKASAWRRQNAGEVAAVLLEGHIIVTGIVDRDATGPLVLGGGRYGLTRAEVDFLVKLLNGEY